MQRIQSILHPLLGLLLLFQIGCSESKKNDDSSRLLALMGMAGNSLGIEIMEPVGTLVSVTFIDSATGNPIAMSDGELAQVRLSGDDGDKVMTLDRVQSDSFQVADGFLNVALREDVVPAEERPVRFSIVVQAPGYIGTSRKVTLSTIGEHAFTIPMVSLNNVPSGVAVAENTSATASESGELADSVFLSTTPTEETSGTSASVTAKAGTVVRDANGDPLRGQITTRLTFFSSESQSSLLAFPGGLSDVTFASDENGESSEGAFISAGMPVLSMTDEFGNVANRFDPPVSLDMVIPGDTIDAVTGEPLAVGSTIPFWNYNQGDGTWEYAGLTKITGTNSDGNFMAVFDGMDQLTGKKRKYSARNADWRIKKCPLNITIAGNEAGVPLKMVTTITYKETDPSVLTVLGAKGYSGSWDLPRGNSTANYWVSTAYSPPHSWDLNKYAIQVFFGTTLVGAKSAEMYVRDAGTCDSVVESIDVSLPETVPVNLVDTRVRCDCEDDAIGDLNARINGPIWYRKMECDADGQWWQSDCQWKHGGWINENGDGTIHGLKLGTQYQFRMRFQSSLYEDRWLNTEMTTESGTDNATIDNLTRKFEFTYCPDE